MDKITQLENQIELIYSNPSLSNEEKEIQVNKIRLEIDVEANNLASIAVANDMLENPEYYNLI